MTPPNSANPTPPQGLEDAALERARTLLTGRLKRGGISTTRPEWFFEVENDGAPQHYPAGWQVRVRTWRHWSDARVHLESEKAVTATLSIPKDAKLRVFWHEWFAQDHKVARLEWDHYFRDVRVDGDYLWVQIHPVTKRLVAFGRKWRTVQLK
jgi:hypothetical protein